MAPYGIKEKFEFYRKWLQTLLITEFLNLPFKYQKQFITLVEKFLGDCKRFHSEAVHIKEKIIRVKIDKIETPDNREESYILRGSVKDSKDTIKIHFPVGNKKPEIGSSIEHIVYSIDEDIWYSSKEELITGRKK